MSAAKYPAPLGIGAVCRLRNTPRRPTPAPYVAREILRAPTGDRAPPGRRGYDGRPLVHGLVCRDKNGTFRWPLFAATSIRPCFTLLCTAMPDATRLISMKGRPPKPKHVLQIAGSKHAKNREELGTAPEPGGLQPPEWLKPRAKEIFGRLVEWLTRMGTLAETDEHVLCRYCTIYVAWEHAACELQKVDKLWVEILAPDGTLRFCRPTAMAAQAKECGEQLRHLETVLGLTPADRTRLGYGAVKVVADPVDALFDDAATA